MSPLSRLLRRAAPNKVDAPPAHVVAAGAWIDDVIELSEPDLLAAIRRRSRDEQRAAAIFLYLTLEQRGEGVYRTLWSLRGVRPALTALTRRRLDWTEAETRLLWTALTHRVDDTSWRFGFGDILKLPLAAISEVRTRDPDALLELTPTVEALLADIDDVSGWYDNGDRTRTRRRLTSLLPPPESGDLELPATVLQAGDSFGPAVRAELLASFEPRVVVPFLTHLAEYSGGINPAKGWARTLTAQLAEQPARGQVARTLLTRVVEHQETVVRGQMGDYSWASATFVSPETALLLRGAVWAAREAVLGSTVTEGSPAADTVAVLSAAALYCGGGLGGAAGEPRCALLTSSTVAALGELDGDIVVSALSQLRDRLRNRTILKGVDKALQAVASRSGTTPSQLLERSVPTFGLARSAAEDPRPGTGSGTARSTSTRRLGEHLATVTADADGVRLGWATETGRPLRSVPKRVRNDHADAVADLRSAVKQAQKVLTGERTRLEHLLATDRTWQADEWVRLYAEHPVTGIHATRLLWERTATPAAEDGSAEWTAGLPTRTEAGWALRSAAGDVAALDDTATVRMWHPIRVPAAEVAEWREHIQDAGLRQPFKQAYREVYRLTPAEEVTDTYSNRYAAHILRYRQAGALMRNRGWVGNHLGYWDGGYDGEAVREFTDTGWRAAFYYDLVENAEGDGYGTPSYCSSDQVRFTHRTTNAAGHDHWDQARMADVPELILTEAMRDVDLFVGVTSIAADPEWIDHGEDRYRNYWTQTSFGELTESAQVRREALARLMPRTKIADRVRVNERFLEVDGTRRTYKIHLGSGNILMSPNDTYLCIVVDRGTGARAGDVFLPFEEDGGMLSVIVSKAFLLAADDKITDSTILRQLNLT